MDRLSKYFPMAVGLLLGLLWIAAPEWLLALAWARYPLVAGVVLLLLIGFVALLVAANLPEEIRMRPSSSVLPPEMKALAEQYRALGFAEAGPPREVGVSPPALVLAFVSPAEKAYGTVFRTGTVPAKVAFDLFSYLERGRGGLSTAAERGAGTLPAGPGAFNQLFPGSSVAQLLGHHRLALAFLRARGLRACDVSAEAFETDFRAGLARQRRNFLASPIRGAATAIWRTATRTTPHLGPIEAQGATERQIRHLLTGPRA